MLWLTEPKLTADQQRELGLDLGFEDQSEAEEWLSGFWSELVTLGVTAVSLTDGGEVVFGPMSLEQ